MDSYDGADSYPDTCADRGSADCPPIQHNTDSIPSSSPIHSRSFVLFTFPVTCDSTTQCLCKLVGQTVLVTKSESQNGATSFIAKQTVFSQISHSLQASIPAFTSQLICLTTCSSGCYRILTMPAHIAPRNVQPHRAPQRL